jgi:hypothetical protein
MNDAEIKAALQSSIKEIPSETFNIEVIKRVAVSRRDLHQHQGVNRSFLVFLGTLSLVLLSLYYFASIYSEFMLRTGISNEAFSTSLLFTIFLAILILLSDLLPGKMPLTLPRRLKGMS